MNLYNLPILYLILLNVRYCELHSPTSIEQVDDTDLVHLLTGEDFVIALFTKSICPECGELESVVENIQKDLTESLGAVVVKSHNSHLLGIYNPSRDPSLIFFRRGIPLLYYGETSENEILQTFHENKEPAVKELSDDNFEHLTQATTGATTGDWFIFFYSADCVLCQRLYAVWEAVGAKLKRRLNVARINRTAAGLSTAKRFSVTTSPEFLFIRQGKVYRYKHNDFTPKAFIQFAENGYLKQTRAEDVPAVPSAMTDFFNENIKHFIVDSQIIVVVALIFLSIILILIIVKFLSKPTSKQLTKTKKTK